MPAETRPLLPDHELDAVHEALAGFTVDAVDDLLGPAGREAMRRGDLAGVSRAAGRSATDASGVATLVRLFLLAEAVPERVAGAALAPLPVDAAVGSGLLERDGDQVRAAVEIRPYAEGGAAPPWWVVSDFGSDVRPGPLRRDHVLGIGQASLTLAQAVPRAAVGDGLDLGTGSGVQALHLGRHAGRVVATDVSSRALRFAATTASLSGQNWQLRHGSLFEPVADELFDLVVANPPFVVSPGGSAGYDYRDSGLPGDGVTEQLLRSAGGRLRPHGTAVLLANWVIPPDGDWRSRLTGWLAGSGCDAWIWQREVASPAEYVALWLRDAGEQPGTPRWRGAYDGWLDWFAANGVAAVGMGAAFLWRTEGAGVTVLEDVPQPVEQPAGGWVGNWVRRQRWLASTGDDDLLAASFDPSPGLQRSDEFVVAGSGWVAERSVLRQRVEARWEIETDDSIAAVVAGLAGGAPLLVPVTVLAGALGSTVGEVAAAVMPVVRDLVARGVLLPSALVHADAAADAAAAS